jgi:adenosylcobinamide-phosphate synthase
MDFWLQVLMVALLFDIILGEPPSIIHPVVWMGKLIDVFVQKAPVSNRKAYGFFIVFFCTGTAVFAGLAIASLGNSLLSLLIAAFFLKSTFSMRMLLFSAHKIRKDLEAGRIENVRKDLKTFVGRNTKDLNEQQCTSAVVESIAESFVDGFLSPLFYFLIFGLPGALCYRIINTLDSMVGYRKEPFIELGYAAARLDDLANWIPARLSLIFIFVASIPFGKPVDAVKTCISDHNKTASPNSGWSMAAVSGALGVRLEKIGYHVIGANYDAPQTFQINRAIHIVGLSSILAIAGIFMMSKMSMIGF